MKFLPPLERTWEYLFDCKFVLVFVQAYLPPKKKILLHDNKYLVISFFDTFAQTHLNRPFLDRHSIYLFIWFSLFFLRRYVKRFIDQKIWRLRSLMRDFVVSWFHVSKTHQRESYLVGILKWRLQSVKWWA